MPIRDLVSGKRTKERRLGGTDYGAPTKGADYEAPTTCSGRRFAAGDNRQFESLFPGSLPEGRVGLRPGRSGRLAAHLAHRHDRRLERSQGAQSNQ